MLTKQFSSTQVNGNITPATSAVLLRSKGKHLMQKFWVGVVSREHVLAGVKLGICQLNHGKESAVARLSRGDKVILYSPRSEMKSGKVVQAFTALGEIADDAPFQAEQKPGFQPFRRKVVYDIVKEASIRPLLEHLSFTRNRSHWGMAFRRGVLEISYADYNVITSALHCKCE